MHWFGSSIQQFTKPGMLSLGHARVGRASLAMVVFSVWDWAGGCCFEFCTRSLVWHCMVLELHSFRSSISTIDEVGISLSWSCWGGLGR